VLYGFHSNMPVGTAYLAPWHWAQMVWRMARMPAFDPMDLVLSSRAVAGFNLSFFADEHALIDQYMTQLLAWLADGSLRPAPIAREFALNEVGEAHALIQSGRTTGKLVVKCA
jgi:NADPH:quinone reductase-like Zn-dependent oxidoreductase